MTGTPIIEQKGRVLTRKSVETSKKRDLEHVTGIFRNHEQEGGTLRFFFRKHKGTPVMYYTFKDNEMYSIPRCVATHLNTRCAYKTYEVVEALTGVRSLDRPGIPRKRVSFEYINAEKDQDEAPKEETVEV